MVGTANEWLERNDHLEVVNCETIRVLYKFNDCGNYYELRPNVVSHYVYGSEKNNILKVLRLWMRKRTEIGTNLQDSPGTQGSVTTFATAVHTSTVETGRAAQFVALAANSSASSVLGDAGYESVRSGSILHRSLIATESSDSTNSEPANFTSVLSREIKSDSFDSPTNESVPIAPTNLTAAKQQHHFRLQQQNSQQQFQLQSGTNAPPPSGATNAGTNVTSSGNVGNASGTNVTATVTMSTNTATTTNRLNRQQSLHRQLSFQQQLSPKLRNKSKMAKAAPKFDLLDYVDIVPECNESRSKDSPTGGPSSLAKSDKFERLDDCVRRLNSMLTTGRIRGQLLCVETIAAEASIDWKVYPEKNFTEFSSKTILFLRCYFRPDLEVETPQQVGKKFVPLFDLQKILICVNMLIILYT